MAKVIQNLTASTIINSTGVKLSDEKNPDEESSNDKVVQVIR